MKIMKDDFVVVVNKKGSSMQVPKKESFTQDELLTLHFTIFNLQVAIGTMLGYKLPSGLKRAK